MACVSVVVPWRGGCPHREAAWQWVRNRYETEHPDWQVVTGGCGDGAWVKAYAVADAVRHADGDLLVIADADCWVEGIDPHAEPWAVPHLRVHRLTEDATRLVLDGAPVDGQPCGEKPYRGHIGGGIVCLSRALYDEVPFDPRFVGWGQEDDALGIALTTIAGEPARGDAPLWHLWHPPQPRADRHIGSTAGKKLLRRYRLVAGDQPRMRALLDEIRQEVNV